MGYLKLATTSRFTPKAFLGSKYKKFDDGKWLQSNTPAFGFRQMFAFETEDGILELGSGQLGNMLSQCMDFDGSASIIDKTFTVASNGKEGTEKRYFIDRVLGQVASVHTPTIEEKTPVNPDDIPF